MSARRRIDVIGARRTHGHARLSGALGRPLIGRGSRDHTRAWRIFILRGHPERLESSSMASVHEDPRARAPFRRVRPLSHWERVPGSYPGVEDLHPRARLPVGCRLGRSRSMSGAPVGPHLRAFWRASCWVVAGLLRADFACERVTPRTTVSAVRVRAHTVGPRESRAPVRVRCFRVLVGCVPWGAFRCAYRVRASYHVVCRSRSGVFCMRDCRLSLKKILCSLASQQAVTAPPPLYATIILLFSIGTSSPIRAPVVFHD